MTAKKKATKRSKKNTATRDQGPRDLPPPTKKADMVKGGRAREQFI